MAKPLLTSKLVPDQPSVTDLEGDGFRLRVDWPLGIAKLRAGADRADTSFRSVAGCAPPPARQQIERAGLSFAWLAPAEWLVTGPADNVAAWLADAQKIGGDDILAMDFTHARVAFELVGEKARAALAAHCPLDLWPVGFPEGSVARSLLGDAGMFIARLADEAGAPRFRIIVDQTMASYARRLFAGTDQSQEFYA